MIEGTRQYKGGTKKDEATPVPTTEHVEAPQGEAATKPSEESDAMNLERREWFSSLIPALGDGLVKILRASNNLQRDLHETLKAKADKLAEPDVPESGNIDEPQN